MTRGLRMWALAVPVTLAAASSARADANRAEFLALLHDGRFGTAEETLRRAGSNSRPDDLFLGAFATYWRLVFDDDNQELRVSLEEQLDATIAAAERASDAGGDGDAALWGGSSHLLLAELRASQRRPLAAAFEAKKAKRLLESKALSKEAASDAQFGLGTYNYVADAVPSYVKGLRALLFIPKGDRDKGLRQLSAVASGSRFFALEARAFLITVYSNKRERQYALALKERDRLLEASPETIAASYASARLDLSLGRNEASIDRLGRAERRAEALGDVDPVVLRSIDLLRARAELAALRPDRARATAERALATGRGLGPGLRKDLEAVRQAAMRQAEGIPWSRLEATIAREHEAAALSALASEHPGSPLLDLLAGDADLRAGRPDEALKWFARAEEAGLSPELQPACRLRQGQATDLLGQRERALAIYKTVATTTGFVARDAAVYLQQVPFGLVP